MTVTNPVLKKIVTACEHNIKAETEALTGGMHRSFEDVKASVASIGAFRQIISECEKIQKTED